MESVESVTLDLVSHMRQHMVSYQMLSKNTVVCRILRRQFGQLVTVNFVDSL